MRKAKTFTIEESLLADIERTRGSRSVSARVNELLSRALDLERRSALEREAALFYSAPRDRREEVAFQTAALRSLKRD
jgi:hypothetical protein